MEETAALKELRKRMLKSVRQHIGHYCKDEYWEPILNDIIAREDDPLQYLEDHMGDYAVNAIATDMTYKNG